MAPSLLLRALMEDQVGKRPGQNFLSFGDARFTFQETDRNTNRVANILLELGLKPGDRVGVFLPNEPEFLFCWFATIKLNLILVPVNIHLKGDALRFILDHSDPHLLITNSHLFKQIQALPGVLATHCKILVLGEMSPNQNQILPMFSYSELMARSTFESPKEFPTGDEDPAMILYTSGTTGHPKGVGVNRRAQTNHPLFYHSELLQTNPGEMAYTYLPLFHVTSQGVTMGSYIQGGALTLDREFNVFGFWDRIRRSKALVFPYLGAVLSMLYARPPKPNDLDNPAVRALGAAAPKQIWASFQERFGVELLETYGQSEWVSIWVMHPPGQTRIGAAGKEPSRAEIKIVDEAGKETPPGTPGQILMRPKGPGLMMSGYYKQPELNEKVFKYGWYFTGDLGEIDRDGYLYFKGRLKDYIRRRGENISAFEIERVVNSHLLVLESAAVGVPSSLGEEEVKLCLALKPAAKIGEEEIWKFCRANLPSFMVPRYIEILSELPHTATQRVRKFILAGTGVEGAWDRKKLNLKPPQK